MSKFAVHEIFDTLNTIVDTEARRQSLRSVPDSIKKILHWWINDNIKFNLPEGAPPFTTQNDVNTHNAFWSEIRRLPIFIVGGGYDHLTNNKREQLFVGMLEYIHPKDAELVINLKEKVWPYEVFTIEDVKEVFPELS